jgi:DNA-binding CsgD family transcriptional regulator
MLDGSGLRLHGRLLGHADLDEAQALVPAWLPLPGAVRAAIPAIWTRLLGHPGFNADVIEDLGRAPGQRIVGLGVAVALDERWARRLREDPPAFAAASLYAELLDGRFQPPSDKDLARQNARGEVNFMVLHYGQLLTDLANPDTLQVMGVAMALFRLAHAGYRLQSLYQEGLPAQAGYLLSMGFRQRTDRCQADRPDLFGLHRLEASLLLPGTPVRDAFQFTPPRFAFAASERRLLRLAVTDLPDEAIGDELGISGHGVKKLWRQAHQRAQDAMPGLFVDGSQQPGGDGGGRGPEKRRVLLRYLRQHPEELRPYSVGAARAHASEAWAPALAAVA